MKESKETQTNSTTYKSGTKKYNQLEYIVKGFSNRRRINVLFLLDKEPELSVTDIAKKLGASFNNTSAHLLKMMATGLVMKRYSENEVLHALTVKGKIVLDMLKKI